MFSRLVIGPFLFPWNVKWLIFSSWIVISIVAVKHDFAKLFSVKREINVIFLMSLFFVNCERTVLFSVKRDLDPPLYHPLPRSEEGNVTLTVTARCIVMTWKCTHAAHTVLVIAAHISPMVLKGQDLKIHQKIREDAKGQINFLASEQKFLIAWVYYTSCLFSNSCIAINSIHFWVLLQMGCLYIRLLLMMHYLLILSMAPSSHW